jgi:hypothetical protein
LAGALKIISAVVLRKGPREQRSSANSFQNGPKRPLFGRFSLPIRYMQTEWRSMQSAANHSPPNSLLTGENTGNFRSSSDWSPREMPIYRGFRRNWGSARNRNRVLTGAVSGNAEQANRENGDFRQPKYDGASAGVLHLADERDKSRDGDFHSTPDHATRPTSD